jgi:hypothetical protein
MNPDIEELQQQVTSPEVLPAAYLRRNVPQYELVSYINHTVALWLGGNMLGVATFVRRARVALDEVGPFLEQPYRDAVTSYLDRCQRYFSAHPELPQPDEP